MTWAIANWRLLAGVAAGLALIAAVWWIDSRGYERGKSAALIEQSAKDRRLTDEANRADADARRCAADPACRMQSDGWRRD